MSVFQRLVGLFLVAGLLPVLGAGYLSQRVAQDAVVAEAERRQARLADLTATLVADAVTRAEEKLTTVARLMGSELVERDVGAYSFSNLPYRETVLERMAALVEPEDVFLELQYFAGSAPGGETQFVAIQQQRAIAPDEEEARTRRMPQINSNVLADPVLKPLSTAANWRGEALEELEGITTLGISAPVHDPQTGVPQVIGAIVAYIDFSALEATLTRIAGEDYALRVADGARTTLIAIGDAGADPLGKEAPVATVGPDWTVTVQEPRARVTASLATLRRQAYLWTGVAVVLAMLLSLSFAGWITRPLRRLRATADALAAGNLQARAELTRSDEIGRLGRAFDEMAGSLAQLDQAKSDFVANVSHELRTPLTSMRLSVANLRDGVVGDLEPRQDRSLQRIQEDLDRMIAMVNTLLEMARLAAGTVTPKRATVDLRALADEGPALVHAAAAERGMAFEVEGAGTAFADADMLRRVLTNLLDNAVKFSPAGSTVRIEVAPGRLRVRDEGPGVRIENPFDRFRQGEEVGVKHAGAGLGLAIVQELVELNEGSVRVEATDRGASFLVELPEDGA